MDRSSFLPCADCKCLAARKAAARLTRSFDRALKPHGLTINQFSLLSALIIGGEATVSGLADRLGIERTTLTRNVALCERDGLTLVRPGEDARQRVVTITQMGLARAKDALPAWEKAQAAT